MPAVKPALPLLNRGHALAQNLSLGWPYYEGSGASVNDVSGNGFTGAITAATWAAGQHGNCLSFNGSTGLVKVAYPLAAVHPLTLAAWVWRAANSRVEVPLWAGWDAQTTWTSHYLSINTDGTCAANTANNNTFAAATTTAAAAAAEWHLLVGVFTSATLRTIYLDGGNAVSGTTSLTPGTINSLYAGATGVAASASSWWTGLVDGIMAWNRALSADDVAALYADTFAMYRRRHPIMAVPAPPPPPGQDQYDWRWRNDDGSEATATWKAAEDTAAVVPAGQTTRLRLGTDTTNLAPGTPLKVLYRKVGDPDWKEVS